MNIIFTIGGTTDEYEDEEWIDDDEEDYEEENEETEDEDASVSSSSSEEEVLKKSKKSKSVRKILIELYKIKSVTKGNSDLNQHIIIHYKIENKKIFKFVN